MVKHNAHTRNNSAQATGCWPTPHQELLLRAALLPKDAALAAWTQWRAEVNIEETHPDHDSFRLLPLVYHNLKQYSVDDPFMQRMKGILHRAWVENQVSFKAGAAVISVLHAAGIETLTLKEVTLTHLHAPDVGARPLSDFDLLVRRDQLPAALAVLDGLGWQPLGIPRHRLTGDYFAVRHAQTFRRGEGRPLALHWGSLPSSFDSADQPFWDAAVPLAVQEMSTRALNPTDLLLLVCVYGLTWTPLPSARWVADAHLLITGAQIDWDRLIRMAERTRTSLALRTALSYLQRTVEAPIPADVLPALERIAVSSAERDLFAAQIQRSGLSGQLAGLWQRYRYHRSQPAQDGSPRLSFVGYVSAYYGHRNLGEFTRWTVARLAQRMTK